MLSDVELSKIINGTNTAKQSWNSFYYMVFAYTQPERNYIWREKGGNPGNLKQVALFTQAGKIGANIFVARIQNKLCPIGKNYINFVPKESDDNSYKEELRDFCALMSKKCNEKKNEINVDGVLSECFYDLVAGTGCVMRERTLTDLKFTHLPITDYKLGMGYNQTLTRNFKLMGYQIPILFPELTGRTIIGIDMIGKEKYEEVPLEDVLFYNEEAKLWEYYLRFEQHTILRRKYQRSPYHIFHWSRQSDMPYGSGVGLQALPAIKRLNSYIKVHLELLPFAFPMFITTSGNFMERNLEFKPGGVLNVGSVDAVRPIQLSTNTQQFQFNIQEEELNIKQIFLDYTLPNNPTQMTAAEVYARSNPQDEMVMMNIAKQTSVIKDIAWDIFDYIYDTQLRGTMDISLEELHNLIDVEINNDVNIDTNLIQKIQGYISTVGMFDPQAIWQSLDRAKTLEALSKAFNLPNDTRRTSDEIEQSAEEAAMAQQEAMQNEIQNQMALENNKENAIANREMAKEEAKQEL